MPELPEVERFREALLPLISKSCCLEVECPSKSPPKKFPSYSQISVLRRSKVIDVKRKGKVLCLVLQNLDENCEKNKDFFCFLRMGMTGRISTESYIPKLESLQNNDEYPPPHTHLILRVNGYEVAYSDPRKFGSIVCADTAEEFEDLAPDGLNDMIDKQLFIGQKKGIKSILLDQNLAVSGVGNWVADEILYQSHMHPDQSYLTQKEVELLIQRLRNILKEAVHCLHLDQSFPKHWIFHSRWKKKQSKKEIVKDFEGRIISFITSGQRSSAIVRSIQKLSKRTSEVTTAVKNVESKSMTKSKEANESLSSSRTKRKNDELSKSKIKKIKTRT